jgi:tetratricopeptide (TPR) repeat protein
MKADVRAVFFDVLNSKETEELLQIREKHDNSQWEDAVFPIVEEILFQRIGSLPDLPIQNQAEQILKKTIDCFQKGDLEQALELCSLILQIQPDLAAAYTWRGKILEAMGQLEQALSDYQSAILLDPRLKDACENLNNLKKDFNEAFPPSDAKYHLDHAYLFARNGEAEKALAECDLARRTLPELAPAYNYLGITLETAGQLEAALEAYLKATQLNPRYYPAQKNLKQARGKLQKSLLDNEPSINF